MWFAIYALTNVEGDPFYVGSTNNPRRRMNEWAKILKTKPEYIILEQGEEGRYHAEEKWIKNLRDQGYSLINKAEFYGGRVHLTKAQRKKVSIANKGKIVSEETRRRMSEALKGKPRNWTPDGEQRVKATQFKKGHKVVVDEAGRIARRAHWARLSVETKSRIARETNLKAWANRTPEERSRIGQKIAATRTRNHTPEELSAIAKRNAAQLIKRRPNIGQEARARMKNWWKSLSPRERASYLRRRTAKIIAAKQAKRLNAKQS